MVEIRLRNAKTKKVEVFEPLHPGQPRMYVCGPTVYDRAHIGNARSAVVFDVLFRLLLEVYGDGNVKFVRNITDIDDKINARARETGRPIGEITAETTQWYFDDLAALGVLKPTHAPRATAYVDQMIAMIDALIDKGHAYAAEGHVLFDVTSYDAYGQLSGRSVEDMIAGARVEVAPYKKNPMDFVLWKPSDDTTPGWDSPWGRGRPGWHIECSAMAKDILGEEFDIHGGGTDLLFPHHENECAQSCALGHRFARIWMHNEMLQVEGKKMSKSLGNFFTVRELLDQGIPGEVVRLVFLMTQYRKPMDWTAEKVAQAQNMLRRWHQVTYDQNLPEDDASVELAPEFLAALGDDLNTHLAITYVNALQSQPQKLLAHARWLGFLGDSERLRFWQYYKNIGTGSGPSAEIASLKAELDRLRKNALVTKDFEELDAFKAKLVAAGLEVRMSRDAIHLIPTDSYDPKSLD